MERKSGTKHCTAILLAAGNGRRMKSSVAKQFMLLEGKPLIWYALNVLEQSEVIDDCILVTGAESVSYVKQEIVEKYGFHKVAAVIPGGAERFLSVAEALKSLDSVLGEQEKDEYIFIHDGARPFLSEEILKSTMAAVEKYHACAAAVPCKDTIKIADEQGFVRETPKRSMVWSIQTPQVFDRELITAAYGRLLKELPRLQAEGISITDDAGVVELFTAQQVKLVEASYQNIKITTPEDIKTAEAFLRNRF